MVIIPELPEDEMLLTVKYPLSIWTVSPSLRVPAIAVSYIVRVTTLESPS